MGGPACHPFPQEAFHGWDADWPGGTANTIVTSFSILLTATYEFDAVSPIGD